MGRGDFLWSVITALLQLSAVCAVCHEEKRSSGEIYSAVNPYGQRTQCWFIPVPENTYVRLALTQLSSNAGQSCNTYVNISVAGTGESFKLCPQSQPHNPVIALNDVNVTLVRNGYTASMKIYFNKENLICLQKNHFRCSNHTCIHQHKVCDGVRDCDNGADEIGCDTGFPFVKGMNESIEMAIATLKDQRSASFGWGPNTHRAITALYLSGNMSFRGDNLEEELITKQLELQTALALLRNSSDSTMSVSDLSMFVNALTVTCHNPRHFYGHDLVKVLFERLTTVRAPLPGPYLTLCIVNSTLSDRHTRSLLEVLEEPSDYAFHFDVQAMALMALTCAKNKTNYFERVRDATRIYNATIRQFISRQLPDGSFGNIYTTAMVTQALLSSGQRNNRSWKLNSTLHYLRKELNSSTDFLSFYFTLPILRGRSLMNLDNVNCTKHRKQEDDEISDVIDKVGEKMRVQYSLYIGDQRDVVHTLYLRVPENSSSYDVMRVAQVADHKYKFLHRGTFGKKYVYEIAGVTNDPETGQFWLLFVDTTWHTVRHHTESPDKLILNDGDHLIMWYKTAQDTHEFPTRYPELFTTDRSSYDVSWHTRTGYPSTDYPWTRRPGTGYPSTYYPGTWYRTGYRGTGDRARYHSTDYPGTWYRTGYHSTDDPGTSYRPGYHSTDNPGTWYRTGYPGTGYRTGYQSTYYPGTWYRTRYPGTEYRTGYQSTNYPGTWYRTGFPGTRYRTGHDSTYYPGTGYRTGYPETGRTGYPSTNYPGTWYRTGYLETRNSTEYPDVGYKTTGYPRK